MTDLLLGETKGDDTSETARPRHRRRLLAIVLLLVILMLAATGWWAVHPERFTYGGAVGSSNVDVGESRVFDTGIIPGYFDDDGQFTAATVTITEISPRVVSNEASAEIVLWLCQRSRASGVGIISSRGIPRFCDPATEIIGEIGQFAYLDHQVLVEVTPTRPGRVIIEGFDVSYRTGLQRGTEHTGMRITVATTR